MITKKLLYVNIPGGVSFFLGGKRGDFEALVEKELDAAVLASMNEVAEKAVDKVLEDYKDKVDPAMFKSLKKYIRVTVGTTSEEAEKSLEAKIGITGINRSAVIRAIKAAYKAEKKGGSSDVEVQTATAEEALSEFAGQPTDVEVEAATAEEFFG
jgi:hypothetical protein